LNWLRLTGHTIERMERKKTNVRSKAGGGTKQDKSHTGTELERVKLEKQNTLTKYV